MRMMREFYSTFPTNGVARNPLSGARSIEWILNNYTDDNLNRVVRGGSWYSPASLVRVANRYNPTPMYTHPLRYIGFRCVRAVQ